MKKALRIICWIKTIIRSFNWETITSGIYTSGHDFQEQENGELVCKVCGLKSKIK